MKKYLESFPKKREKIRPIVVPGNNQPGIINLTTTFLQSQQNRRAGRPTTPIRVSTSTSTSGNLRMSTPMGNRQQVRRTQLKNRTPEMRAKQQQAFLGHLKMCLMPSDYLAAKALVMKHFQGKINTTMFNRKMSEYRLREYNRAYYYKNKLIAIGTPWSEELEKIRKTLFPTDFYKFFEKHFVGTYMKKKCDRNQLYDVLREFSNLEHNKMYCKWKRLFNTDPVLHDSFQRFARCVSEAQKQEFNRDPRNKKYLEHLKFYSQIHRVREKVKRNKRNRENEVMREGKKRKLQKSLINRKLLKERIFLITRALRVKPGSEVENFMYEELTKHVLFMMNKLVEVADFKREKAVTDYYRDIQVPDEKKSENQINFFNTYERKRGNFEAELAREDDRRRKMEIKKIGRDVELTRKAMEKEQRMLDRDKNMTALSFLGGKKNLLGLQNYNENVAEKKEKSYTINKDVMLFFMQNHYVATPAILYRFLMFGGTMEEDYSIVVD